MGSHVYRTTDFARTWTDVTSNLFQVTNVLQEPFAWPLAVIPLPLPGVAAVLVGTSRGAYVAFNDNVGGDWQWALLGAGLPNTFVSEFAYSANDDVLFVSTLGRGLWRLSGIVHTLLAMRNKQPCTPATAHVQALNTFVPRTLTPPPASPVVAPMQPPQRTPSSSSSSSTGVGSSAAHSSSSSTGGSPPASGFSSSSSSSGASRVAIADDSSATLQGGAIIGIAVGVAGVALIALSVWWWQRRKRSHFLRWRDEVVTDTTSGAPSSLPMQEWRAQPSSSASVVPMSVQPQPLSHSQSGRAFSHTASARKVVPQLESDAQTLPIRGGALDSAQSRDLESANL
jgi:hypothetical protein